jgi:hypothetical protein
MYLMDSLETLKNENDVRNVLTKTFNLRQIGINSKLL